MLNITILTDANNESPLDENDLIQFTQKQLNILNDLVMKNNELLSTKAKEIGLRLSNALSRTAASCCLDLSIPLGDYLESLQTSKAINELIREHEFLDDNLKNMSLENALNLINDYYENLPSTEFHVTQEHISALSILLSAPIFDFSEQVENFIFLLLFLLFFMAKK